MVVLMGRLRGMTGSLPGLLDGAAMMVGGGSSSGGGDDESRGVAS